MSKLFLGVGREIITPEIGTCLYGYRPGFHSTAIYDDLRATAFYFSYQDKKALMISLEVCLLNNALVQKILSLLQDECGIDKDCIILSATHTHSGPNTAGAEGWGDIDKDYCYSIFVPKILAAAKTAIKNASPVKMGRASGNSLVGINRRQLRFDNVIDFGQNPWGIFNPQMTVISFQNDEGEIVANIIHYGCHGTCAGINPEISRDWSGIMVDAIEKESGGITAFFNGPEGDVGPRISNGGTTGRGDLYYVDELGYIAARDAHEIFKKITSYHDAQLNVSHKTLLVPLKKRIPLEEAMLHFEEYKDNTINVGGLTRKYYQDIIESYQNGYVDKDNFELPQTVIGLGNLYFAPFPLELFSEIGMRIDNAVKDAQVLSLSCSNGDNGYFVTEDALCRGGYEVLMHCHFKPQQYCDNADWHLVTQTVEHIEKMMEE